MGNIKLYKQRDSTFRIDNAIYVAYRSISRVLDDTIGKGIVMAETKIVMLFLTVIGIPAYIYAYFLDVHGNLELWKGIILTAIGAFTGIVIGCRQLVRLMKEWKEYRKDYGKMNKK